MRSTPFMIRSFNTIVTLAVAVPAISMIRVFHDDDALMVVNFDCRPG